MRAPAILFCCMLLASSTFLQHARAQAGPHAVRHYREIDEGAPSFAIETSAVGFPLDAAFQWDGRAGRCGLEPSGGCRGLR